MWWWHHNMLSNLTIFVKTVITICTKIVKFHSMIHTPYSAGLYSVALTYFHLFICVIFKALNRMIRIKERWDFPTPL